MKTNVFLYYMFSIFLMWLVGHMMLTKQEAVVTKQYNSIKTLKLDVASLQTEADDLGTMLYDFLGVEECQPFKSHINVDLPIRYFREGYISPDLRIIKNIQVGDWVNVEGIGLIQIIGENKRGTNTIRISDAGRDGDRHTYLKKVSWIR